MASLFSLGGSLRAAVSRQNRRAGGKAVAAALGDVTRARGMAAREPQASPAMRSTKR